MEGDNEMTPRQILTSTPFSKRAEVAEAVTDNAISTAQISNYAVTGAKIEDGAVTGAKIEDGAVTGAKIEDGAVTADDIDDGDGSGLDADKVDGHDASEFATTIIVAALEARIAQLEALLQNVTRPDTNTIRFSDVNVQIVNGTGTTFGTSNGLGNLMSGIQRVKDRGQYSYRIA